MWDLGDAGNQKIFTSADVAKIPQGQYVLTISPSWMTSEPLLKELTMRVTSGAKVAIDQISDADYSTIISGGIASMKETGKSCPAYNSAALGTGLSLAQAA